LGNSHTIKLTWIENSDYTYILPDGLASNFISEYKVVQYLNEYKAIEAYDYNN
jgi:hypothetical protein